MPSLRQGHNRGPNRSRLATKVDINVITCRSRSAQERQCAMKRKTVILSAIVMTAVIGVGWAAGVSFASVPPIESDPRQGPQLVKVVTAKPSTGAARAFTVVISARVQSN